MGRWFVVFLSFASAMGAMVLLADSVPTIFLVGDSTMADKPLIGNPERGWGQFLRSFFLKDVLIENHARNGRSTKSFLDEGRWQAVVERLREGDYVMIQFGHNDAKRDDPNRYAAPQTDYKNNLLRFVRDLRARSAHPILITPVCRRRFDAHGRFYDVHGTYPGVVRDVAQAEGVSVLDLHKKSYALFDSLGEERTKQLFLWVPPHRFSELPEGKRDDTHFNSRGAATIAGLIVEMLFELQHPLADFLEPAGAVIFPGFDQLVLLDNFYNNEWRTTPGGTRERYHYVWHDTTNSGFSQLGLIITRLGADIDTLQQPADVTNLQKATIYIIVDPDTPEETDDPHFIADKDANAIVEWVNAGGVLVLLGNDKGNAEFEHLNRLARRFGMFFNDVSRNRVQGNRYENGTLERLPDHPLFTGVRKVFIKELSTLTVQKPATPLLADGSDILVATARVGNGFVCAVGDPWFYNEYMDSRRLPAGYDNARVAENLFRWLLHMARVYHR